MIDRKKLLADLQALLRKEIEPDLRKRSDLPELSATLKAEFDKAKKAKRTAINYTDWRADTITQIGVAWVLSCVFIRFLEDNRLVDPSRLSGPTATGDSQSALQRARDEFDLHIKSNPEHSFRQYILSVIDDLAKLSGGKEVFGKNNIIHQHRNWLSNDAAKSLYNFWQKIEPATGKLVHDFTDDADEGKPFDTRFLGDLYQDLSEAARKKYALLQTPDFVEAFILDRTLEPALEEFGLEPKPPEGSGLTTNTFRMIDPACGSGHFLLGAFDRILDRWQRKEPGTKVDVLVERTLASIHGVDVNPFAVAIARFRLLLAAFRACQVTRLDQPIDFHVNVACGDSLYHGKQQQGTLVGIETDESHYFQVENVDELRHILREGTYHTVVANPPYITPKDKAANVAYRELYPNSCHMKYALSMPFMERIFRLAVRGGFLQGREDAKEDRQASGYTGQITSNSFMKREFGKKLIESFFRGVDLTHVIDTSGAYIPGHGTPTVVLLGRNQSPLKRTIRTVMGIRGEPSTPNDGSQGRVWTAIVTQVDNPGSQSDFISVGDAQRRAFEKHPWSIGGGGAAELKDLILGPNAKTIENVSKSIGFMGIISEDDAYLGSTEMCRRRGLHFVKFATGTDLRDWRFEQKVTAVFPYDGKRDDLKIIQLRGRMSQHFWSFRVSLKNRLMFGKHPEEHGMPWYAFMHLSCDRYLSEHLISFASVATHNQFALRRPGDMLNRHAPVIKLLTKATLDDHLGLLGLLNSSTACFWMKQVFHDKGSTVDSAGARQTTVAFENFREFTGTGLQKCPIPQDRPVVFSRHLHSLAQHLHTTSPDAILTQRCKDANEKLPSFDFCDVTPLHEALSTAQTATAETLGQMIQLQEDLDWQCYQLYGLLNECLVSGSSSSVVDKGERAFEIVMARKMAAGELETTWFERHGSTPITELPEDWPDDYKALVNRRIEVIESNPNIALIEQPEYKRRWNTEPWDSQVERALREWMLLRLESYFDFDGRMEEVVSDQLSVVSTDEITNRKLKAENGPLKAIAVYSVAKLADVAFKDAQFKEVAEVYRGRPDFDPVKLIDELVADEHVPALPVLRYKPAGLDKRAEWESTWRLQRTEDQIHADVERACRNTLNDASAAVVVPDQPLDPYKAKLVIDRIDFRFLSYLVQGYMPGDKRDSDHDADNPIEIRLERAFSASKLGTLAELQRIVTLDCLGDIPVPPKYASSDFISTGGAKYWKLRGKLDVPKERWVSFPHCQGEDQTLAIAWAGYDHLQLLQAIAAYFAEVQQLGGSDDPRLAPLLAAMDQQIPWVKQWHNDTDNEYGYALGDYFEEFIATEARNLGLTTEDVRGWTPPEKAKRATKTKVAKTT